MTKTITTSTSSYHSTKFQINPMKNVGAGGKISEGQTERRKDGRAHIRTDDGQF